MKKTKELKTLLKLMPVFFLLILIEIAILKFREEVSVISLLEISSGLLLIIIYYFLVRAEFKMASDELKGEITPLIERFDNIEDDLKEELKSLESQINELHGLMKKRKK